MAQARPGAAAFPRGRRIRRRPDFVRIQASGRRVTTRHLLLLLAAQGAAVTGSAPDPPRAPRAASPPRLGLVASRKVGGAVQRNRAKRLVREVFRTHPEIFPRGVDIVVILRSGAGDLGRDDVLAEVRGVASLLRRRAAEALAAAPELPSPPAAEPAEASGPGTT